MNAAEFINALKNPNPHSIVKTANGTFIKFDGDSLNNCHFFEDIYVDHGIIFQGVKFNGVTFQKLITKGFVIFNNCKTYKYSATNIGLVALKILIDQNNEFEGEIDFKNCKCQEFDILGGTFSNLLVFYNNEITKLEISGNTQINKSIQFSTNKIQRILINNGKIEKFLYRTGFTYSLTFYGKVVLNEAIVHGGTVVFFTINGSSIYKVSNGLNFDENIEKLNIENIVIQNTEKLLFNFAHCSFNQILFDGGYSSKESIFDFNNIKLSIIRFTNYVNYGQINLKSVEIIEKLSFEKSDIGKFTLIGCSFEKTALHFDKSKILETFIIGCALPNRFIETNELGKIEAYSQIKKIYENRGSQKDALEYYSLEMNALDESLNWKDNFWEKATLWFNKKSTNHGLDWKQGLKSTFLVSAGFFLAYVISLWSFALNPFERKYWLNFLNILSHYFDFINPAHKTDIVAEKLSVEPSPFSRIIEGLSRIFIAYFIYQLIQAFRKHGKK